MIVPSRELMPVVRAALGRGQRVRMTVSGSSMRPFLRGGDVVELEPAETIRLGDVVLARVNGGDTERYVVHRVVRAAGDGAFFLRGDAQAGGEGPLAPADVLGRATTAYRRGRMCALDRGLWRVAGFVWLAVHPLGLVLLRVVRLVRRMGGRPRRR